MEPGMHYLHPVTRALRQRVPILAGLCDRSLLLCWYTFLEVKRPPCVTKQTPTRHAFGAVTRELRQLGVAHDRFCSGCWCHSHCPT